MQIEKILVVFLYNLFKSCVRSDFVSYHSRCSHFISITFCHNVTDKVEPEKNCWKISFTVF